MMNAAILGDFQASWSNRNGGEILVTVGSMRMTVSAAIARAVYAKLGKALDIPARAPALIDVPPLREPERITAPDTMVAESYPQRRDALSASVPHRATRLSAAREALALATLDGAEVVLINRIAFTIAEVETLIASLESLSARSGARA